MVRRKGALLLYAAAMLCVMSGVVLAFRAFPGGFDWAYTVISKLGSPRQNPDGAMWLAGSLLAAVLLLVPVAGYFRRRFGGGARPRRVSLSGFHLGLLAGAILAVEGLFALDFTGVHRKGHEIAAILAFLGFYTGVLGLHLHRVRREGAAVWPALLVVLPLVAVGITQVALYFDQRDLGWVNTAWREIGVPIWLSFAFWQWLAVLFLGAGLGALIVGRGPGARSQAP